MKVRKYYLPLTKIQGVINKYRDCFCNSAMGRSWEPPLCWNVALNPFLHGTNVYPKPLGSSSQALVERVLVLHHVAFRAALEISAEKKEPVCIKFWLNFGKTVRRLLKCQNACGDECFCRAGTCEWFKGFQGGRTSNDDDPQTRRSSKSMEGAVHFEYVSEGDKINRRCYV